MRFGFVLLISLLAACSPRALVTPYKADVQQGNVVTDEMISKVKPGMTKAQVRFALGTPLITDPFHAERWDYVYRMRKEGELVQQSRLTVVFEDDKLKKVEGTVLPPNDNVAGTKYPMPMAIPVLALAPEQARPAKPSVLDLQPLESDLGAAPQAAPSAESAQPESDQSAAKQVSEAQAEQPKRSIGERFMRLFGFGKKDDNQQAKALEKSEPQPEQQPEQKPDQGQVGETSEAQAEQPKLSFGQRIKRLFGFGKEESVQQAKAQEKSEPESDQQVETQPETEAPTNTVITADRAPPPKRSVGERFKRLFGFRDDLSSDDPAPPVSTEVDTSIPRVSSLTFKQVMRQILGLESDSDREKAAAAGDIEPGEKVKSAPQGSTWQRFKRLIGVDSGESDLTYTPVDQQTKPANKDAKPDSAKSDAAKP